MAPARQGTARLGGLPVVASRAQHHPSRASAATAHLRPPIPCSTNMAVLQLQHGQLRTTPTSAFLVASVPEHNTITCRGASCREPAGQLPQR